MFGQTINGAIVGESEASTILLLSNVSGDKSVDLKNDISYYDELTAENFVIMLKNNATATANDATKNAIRYHDINKGNISYADGVVTVTGPLVRTNGRSYNTVVTNISYDLYLMRSIGGV